MQVEKSNCSPVPHAVETHAPPQDANPASHWQIPLAQDALSGQALPQKPQFSFELPTHTSSPRVVALSRHESFLAGAASAHRLNGARSTNHGGGT
jgi:hypothetical protein